MSTLRAILHVDMDAFFASVEQLDDPFLRGRPVLVGHEGLRGVVTAASYEARAFGCRSAQPVAVARRLCPDAIVVGGRGWRYRELSQRVFDIFESVTPLVQPLSIDEAFLDVTGCTRRFGEPPEIARHIKKRIRDEVELPCSVGVAYNKFLAKLGSGLDKPDGLTIITPDDIAGRVAKLPIRKMWGVGPAMEEKLKRFNIRTFADLQRLTEEEARDRLGPVGEHFRRLALGEDEREVVSDHRARSIGSENTFGRDITTAEHVRQVLLQHLEHVAMRMRRYDLRARTVTVKIRYGDFETISRSATLDAPTDRTLALWAAASRLFDRWAKDRFRPVRLIGVSFSNLRQGRGAQMELFADEKEEHQRRIDRAADEITDRFGRGSIHRGIPYTKRPS